MRTRLYKTKSRAFKRYNYEKQFEKLNPIAISYDKEFKWVITRKAKVREDNTLSYNEANRIVK
jgi:hypothetical protein